MSETATVVNSGETGKAPSMGKFERFLTVWVALCILVGIGLGQAVPGVFHALGAATVAQVNLPVAVLVWLMIVPMLLKIDLAALGQVGNHWRGIATTVGVNWLVKPFSMALLGWIFIAHLFRPFLPADQIDGYIAGRSKPPKAFRWLPFLSRGHGSVGGRAFPSAKHSRVQPRRTIRASRRAPTAASAGGCLAAKAQVPPPRDLARRFWGRAWRGSALRDRRRVGTGSSASSS